MRNSREGAYWCKGDFSFGYAKHIKTYQSSQALPEQSGPSKTNK